MGGKWVDARLCRDKGSSGLGLEKKYQVRGLVNEIIASALDKVRSGLLALS